MSTLFKIDYSGWSIDDASPIKDDVKIKTSHKKLVGYTMSGLGNKGRKLSEEHKALLSEAKIGKKMDPDSVKRSIEGSKKTKFKQLLETYPLQSILDAQLKHGNHQFNTCKELGICHTSYVKLCKHYGIEKKKSNKEKTEWAKHNQSDALLVWKASSDGKTKIGDPVEYYSISECLRVFEKNGNKLHKGNMLTNMRKGRAYRGYFFEKKLSTTIEV